MSFVCTFYLFRGHFISFGQKGAEIKLTLFEYIALYIQQVSALGLEEDVPKFVAYVFVSVCMFIRVTTFVHMYSQIRK
jgi:hypothetical protein